MKSINFGGAIEALKNGKCVARHCWSHTEKKFIFMQVPSEIKKTIVPKMQSLPVSAKDLFQITFDDETQQIDAIYYTNQIALVGLSNVIESYTASSQDILAEDWYEC